MAGCHHRQRVGKCVEGMLCANLGEPDLEPQRLRPTGHEIAIAEQIKWRKVQLIAAKPGLYGDVGPDAGRFAQCQRERPMTGFPGLGLYHGVHI